MSLFAIFLSFSHSILLHSFIFPISLSLYPFNPISSYRTVCLNRSFYPYTYLFRPIWSYPRLIHPSIYVSIYLCACSLRRQRKKRNTWNPSHPLIQSKWMKIVVPFSSAIHSSSSSWYFSLSFSLSLFPSCYPKPSFSFFFTHKKGFWRSFGYSLLTSKRKKRK